jgi:2-polyprenyl-3-methyl-5-hydroxy-6-metoxy-1,4-benzoquinol methylase
MSDDPVIAIGTREGYDQWSAFYDQDDNLLIRLDHQEIDARLRNLAGKRVLDVGCGTGRHAIPLATSGAKGTGIDFSEGMLSLARSKPGASDVTWLCQDLAKA